MQDKYEQLLPLYANNSLDEPQRTELEAALRQDKNLRAELEFIQMLRSQVKSQQPPQSPGELGLARLKRDLHEKKPHKTSFWLKPALAAAVFVIVAQTGVIVQQQQSGSYTPLSGTQQTSRVIQVSFSPSTTEAQLRDALNSIDAQIVDGPSALGIYRISLPDNLTQDTAIAKLETYAFIASVGKN